MCDEGAPPPFNASRAERIKELAEQLGLDAILLVTGFDGCYNLESKGLVEWLCDLAASPRSQDFKAAALEEGLFIAMPDKLEWSVQQDSDDMAEDAVSALDRLLADPAASAAGAAAPMDISSDELTPEAAAEAATAGELHPAVDGKLSLLLHLHPHLKRVGIALGVEVRAGVQQHVPAGNIFRWPLLMALAEQLHVPMEQLFEEVVDITPSLRSLLGYVDGTHLHNTLRLRRPLVTRSWLEAIGVCGRRSNTPKLDLTEAAVAAPLTEFVTGCGCRLKPGQYQPLALPPRVLFGQRTSEPSALSCPNISLRSQAAKQGTAVLHATVEAADACSPLRVARTIFFGQGAAAAATPLQLLLEQQAVGASSVASANATQSAGSPTMCRCNSGSANNGAGGTGSCCCSSPQQQQQWPQLPLGQAMAGGDFDVDHRDLFDLMCWYWAAVDAAWQAMQYYSTQEGATWESSKAFATQVFWKAAAVAQLVPQHLQPQERQQQQQGAEPQQQQQEQQVPQLSLQLFSWDGGPRPMPSTLNLEQHSMRFKTLRVAVSGINSRSPNHPGWPLGNVLYMDTFLDVPAIGDAPPQLVNLTLTHCPTYSFNFWGTEATTNSQLVAAFRRHLQLQLQLHAQAQAEAQARAVLRKPADDTALMRLQQELRSAAASAAGAGKTPVQRCASMGQSQQLLLLQQLAGASNGMQQQLQQQLQQQVAKAAGGINGSRQQQNAWVGKHALGTPSCCGQPDASCQDADGSGIQQAVKRSCCGTPEQQCNGAASPQQLLPFPEGGSSTAAPAMVAAAAAAAAARSNSITTTPGVRADAAANASGSNGGKQPSAAAGSNGGSASFMEAFSLAGLSQLGRLLVPPGEMPGEVALLFTGAMKLAVMDGPLYPYSNGLVFVSRPTKVHILPLDQLEAVWLQHFASQVPGLPDLGPCVVIKGKQPCCGLLPATHMTDNFHVALSLRAMSKACSQHWVTAVLPAWQAAAGVVKSSKGASAPWPLPAQYSPFYTYWLLGARKRYMLPQPDDIIDVLTQVLDLPSPKQHQQQQQHQQQ